MTDIDTGVFSVPTTRPSTFTPFTLANGIMLSRPVGTLDAGVGSNPAALANTFDDVLAVPVTASPGY